MMAIMITEETPERLVVERSERRMKWLVWIGANLLLLMGMAVLFGIERVPPFGVFVFWIFISALVYMIAAVLYATETAEFIRTPRTLKHTRPPIPARSADLEMALYARTFADIVTDTDSGNRRKVRYLSLVLEDGPRVRQRRRKIEKRDEPAHHIPVFKGTVRRREGDETAETINRFLGFDKPPDNQIAALFER